MNLPKWLGINKIINFLKMLKQPNGITDNFINSFRIDVLRFGTVVGEDKFGNKYYENNKYFFGTNRWVIYNSNVYLNYDASQVPAEWFGWLHYKTDLLPHRDISRPKYKWMIDHTPNLSGTEKAYVPYSTTKPKIQAWQPK